MSDATEIVQSPSTLERWGEGVVCWICYEGATMRSPLISPCDCRGDTRYSHSACLLRWIDQKQAGIMGTAVVCPQCHYQYRMALPRATTLAALYELATAMKNFTVPVAAIAGLVSGMYVCAVSYGALVASTMLDQGTRSFAISLYVNDPLRFYVGLPLIPLSLLFTRFPALEPTIPFFPTLMFFNADVRFFPPNRETVLLLLPYVRVSYNYVREKIFRKLLGSAFRATLPTIASDQESSQEQPAEQPAAVPAEVIQTALVERDPQRSIVNVLLLPIVAAVVGNLTLQRVVRDPFMCSILGGFAVIVTQDLSALAYSLHSIWRRVHRRIVERKEE